MQTSKFFKRILSVVIIAVLLFAGFAFLKLALSRNNSTTFYNYDYEQLQKKGEKIDMLILGGSRMYRSFDPEIFESELGLKTVVNDATPTQNPILSYYLLQEVLKYDKPETLIMGVSFDILNGDQSIAHYVYGMDRLHGWNKLACTYECYGFNDGLMAFIRKDAYRDNLSVSKILSNISHKLRGMQGDWDSESYGKNGYIGSKSGYVNGTVPSNEGRKNKIFDTELINPKYLEYLDKIMDLCKEEGIEVHMVSGMCTTMQMYDIVGYQEATDYFAEYAKNHGIDYFNLNFIKDREERYPDSCFVDFLHLNYIGGQQSSHDYTTVLKKLANGEDPSDMFYKDLNEFKATVHRIPGCEIRGSRTGDVVNLTVDSKHNDEVTPQYRLLATCDDEDLENKSYKPISDWSTKTTYQYSFEELSKYKRIKIEAKTGEEGELIANTTKPLKDLTNEKQ